MGEAALALKEYHLTPPDSLYLRGSREGFQKILSEILRIVPDKTDITTHKTKKELLANLLGDKEIYDNFWKNLARKDIEILELLGNIYHGRDIKEIHKRTDSFMHYFRQVLSYCKTHINIYRKEKDKQSLRDGIYLYIIFNNLYLYLKNSSEKDIMNFLKKIHNLEHSDDQQNHIKKCESGKGKRICSVEGGLRIFLALLQEINPGYALNLGEL